MGFIHDKLDIKILILFILERLAGGVELDTLTELTLHDDGISYFDYSECVGELLRTGHIEETDGLYAITEKGREHGRAVESSIPYSVRMHANERAARLAGKQRRDALIKTAHTERATGGYTTHLAMSDGLGQILAIDLYAAGEDQAKLLETGFRKKAESVYSSLIEQLTSGTERSPSTP